MVSARCMRYTESDPSLILLISSSSRELGFESVQDHPGLHVVRRPRMAGLAPGRGGGHQTHQVCVRRQITRTIATRSRMFYRYEHGITTFDTANVSHPSVESWPITLIPGSATGLLERSLRGHSRKCDQEAQPPPRGARYLDQGEHIDYHDYVYHLTGSVLCARSTSP